MDMFEGASTCSSCSKGKFQDNTGKSSCKACADECAYGSSLSPCTATSNLMCLCSNGVCYKSTFNFSGRDQIWAVPAGVSSAQVKLWAAGGGGGRDHGCRFDGGGGGSAIIATLSGLTSVQNLTVVVGQGGFRGALGSSVGENPYGGGGKRGYGATFGLIDNLQNGGAGGGRSEISFAGRKIVVAGAGGGTLQFSFGGASGSYWPDGLGRNGGGASLGGEEFIGGRYCGGINQSSTPGKFGIGGDGGSWGAGGGGGYYGGGGSSWVYGCFTGGGGGSSYWGGTQSIQVSNVFDYPGEGSSVLCACTCTSTAGLAPGNMNDTDYPYGVGWGGNSSDQSDSELDFDLVTTTDGGNGFVWIGWSPDCQDGYQFNGSICSACIPGFYSSGKLKLFAFKFLKSISTLDTTGTGSCLPCSLGTFSNQSG